MPVGGEVRVRRRCRGLAQPVQGQPAGGIAQADADVAVLDVGDGVAGEPLERMLRVEWEQERRED